ncbi:MAG: hypothetical protein IJS28_02045 [Synergistaceae bacterium]|nr:hypothetical protein [Synergistaceae bacterium]
MELKLSPELEARVDDWAVKSGRPGEELIVELLDEYFDDCDDADRLEALIQAGKMGTTPASIVHKELEELAAVGS